MGEKHERATHCTPRLHSPPADDTCFPNSTRSPSALAWSFSGDALPHGAGICLLTISIANGWAAYCDTPGAIGRYELGFHRYNDLQLSWSHQLRPILFVARTMPHPTSKSLEEEASSLQLSKTCGREMKTCPHRNSNRPAKREPKKKFGSSTRQLDL